MCRLLSLITFPEQALKSTFLSLFIGNSLHGERTDTNGCLSLCFHRLQWLFPFIPALSSYCPYMALPMIQYFLGKTEHLQRTEEGTSHERESDRKQASRCQS